MFGWRELLKLFGSACHCDAKTAKCDTVVMKAAPIMPGKVATSIKNDCWCKHMTLR